MIKKVNYAPISSLFRILPPQTVMPLYLRLLNSGDDMVGYFSDSLTMSPIPYIDAFSTSDIRVIFFS